MLSRATTLCQALPSISFLSFHRAFSCYIPLPYEARTAIMASNTIGAVDNFDFNDHSAMTAASAFIMEYDTALAAIKCELEQAEEDVRNAQLTDDYDNIEASVQNVRRLNENLATLNCANEICQIRIDAKGLLRDLKKASQGKQDNTNC